MHLIIARTEDERRSGEIAKAIDELAESSPFQTRTRTENAYAAVQWRQINDLRVIGNFITIGVLFTLLVVSASTMMQSVRQRFSELAVVMAVGFTPARVAALVVGEALMLSSRRVTRDAQDASTNTSTNTSTWPSDRLK